MEMFNNIENKSLMKLETFESKSLTRVQVPKYIEEKVRVARTQISC